MSASVAAAVAGLGLFALLLIQDFGLRSATRSSLVALRAAAWFADHRLAEGVVTIAGLHPSSSFCASSWFTRSNRLRAPGSLATVGSRFAVLVVPPHTIKTRRVPRSGGGLSPLLVLELAGCPRLFSRQLAADAKVAGATKLSETLTSQGPLWTLRFRIKATRVTLYLEPGTVRPIALAIASPRLRARTRIRFGLLSSALLRELGRRLRPQRTKRVHERKPRSRVPELGRPVVPVAFP